MPFHRYAKVLICVPLLCLFLFSNGQASVKKAKEFMTAGMYPQAIELLDKRINDKPTDAEAHYQLGICFINTGNFHGADERFASAVRLKPDYGFQIGRENKKGGVLMTLLRKLYCHSVHRGEWLE